jgi:hypothetical protein
VSEKQRKQLWNNGVELEASKLGNVRSQLSPDCEWSFTGKKKFGGNVIAAEKLVAGKFGR